MVIKTKEDKNLVIPASLGNYGTGSGEGGITPEQAAEIASAITESAISEYDTELQVDLEDMREAISANTQSIEDLSGLSADIEALSAATSANTEAIEAVSAATTANTAAVEALSAATSGLPAEIEELAGRYTIITASTTSGQAFWNNLYDRLSGLTEEQRMGFVIYLKDVKVKFANGVSNYYDYVMRYMKYTDGVYFSGISTIYKGGGQIGNGCFLTLSFKNNSFVLEQEISATVFQLRLNNNSNHTVTFNTYDGCSNLQIYRSLAGDGSLTYIYFYVDATGQVVPAKSIWYDSNTNLKIIELEYDYSGTTYYGKWSLNDGGTFTNLAWTETPQGGGGGSAGYREFFINNMTNAERADLYSEIRILLGAASDSANLPQLFSGYRFYVKYDIDGQRWCESFFSNFEGQDIWLIGCKPHKLSYPFEMFRIGAILHPDGSVDYTADNAYVPPIPNFVSVAFGNSDIGGLSYNTSTGLFTLGGVDYASGDTTTPVQDVYDYNFVINGLLTRTGDFDDGGGNVYKCINAHTITITDNGEDITLTSPAISMKGITSYTVDDIEFNREITFNYGDWKLIMDVAESNVGINLRVQ